MIASLRIAFAGLAVVVLGMSPSLAHDARPLHVEIAETSPGTVIAEWQYPLTIDANNAPTVLLSTPCEPLAAPVAGPGSGRQIYRCAEDISGAGVQINYPRFNPSLSTIITFERTNGETYSQLLSPGVTNWQLPEAEAAVRIAGQYTRLGVEHILLGYDHLLFIVCLILLAGTFRRILITITGFTIAHSITLALAALDLVRLPVAAVEASIALSIVFVASELARGRKDTVTWRYPISVSATFGLLHGFGFAAVLSDIGLPQTQVPAALLFFNVGVEIGQIIFVLAAVLIFQVIRRLLPSLQEQEFPGALAVVQRPAVYVVGPLALFWTFERVAGFWS